MATSQPIASKALIIAWESSMSSVLIGSGYGTWSAMYVANSELYPAVINALIKSDLSQV